MSKVLALLSGKGGSGKTTLALSIASMLSKCKLKVLLVDCDLSTNGATYFYEEKLAENTNELSSFYNLFISDINDDSYRLRKVIKIDEYMDFMPSIVKITKLNSESYRYREQDLKKVDKIDKKLRDEYDVIIYDCQAGYTDILKLLLPYVDINLVVMEADAISSAAIRSFYLKVGNLLNDKKIYQIFNKATDEEYEIYSKISGGTVFTNIETVRFDWKIRKAFSVAQIPDMQKTSARYGEQVYNICKVLFKDEKIQEGLKKYEFVIKINRMSEEENDLKDKIEAQISNEQYRKNKLYKYMYLLVSCASLIMVFFVFNKKILIESSVTNTNNIMFFIFLIIIVIYMMISALLLNDITKNKRTRARMLEMNQRKLDEVLKEKNELQYQLDKIEKKK